MAYAWVVGFGVLGVTARFVVNHFFFLWGGHSFPYHTLLINVVGSFLIGFVFIFAKTHGLSDNLRLGIMSGLLGGFTTFSAYSLESWQLFAQGRFLLGGFYLVSAPALGLLAAGLGIYCGQLAA